MTGSLSVAEKNKYFSDIATENTNFGAIAAEKQILLQYLLKKL